MGDIAKNITTLVERLKEAHPNATYELDWSTPEEMLVATTLAAQCTDKRVNTVTSTLFKKYPSPKAFAEADPEELGEDLKPTGFYRQKTRAVQGICKALVERFDGTIPKSMKDLTSIRGVARKTANVVLNCCFNLPTGIIVDTHVARVSGRMGLSGQKKPEKIERDLMELIPKEEWAFFGPAMVLHGRYTCTAKKPNCITCPFLDLCPRIKVITKVPATPIDKARTRTKTLSDTARKGAVEVDEWVLRLRSELDKPYFTELLGFVEQERATHQVFPPAAEVFSAFSLTPFQDVKVLILGQDPYHDDGQAHGLAFSVKPGVKPPPSLRNIYKELKADLGITPPTQGNLESWSQKGVMLLNAVLTVRAHEPNSHKGKGWETFTDAVISTLSQERDHIVFLLWGNYAQKKARLIDRKKHTIIEGAHPSPLSARLFFGSRPFSAVNSALSKQSQGEIDWSL